MSHMQNYLVPIVDRADQPRRAVVRHLLPAAQGAHRVPRHADRRRRGQPGHGPAPAPGERGPGQGHPPVHQLARRRHHRPCSRSTTRCSTSSPTCPPSAWARPPRPRRCCWRRARGQALALPHSRVLIHQPHGGAQGQAVDIEIQAKEILRMPPAAGRDPGRAHRPDRREGQAGHRPRLHHDAPSRPRTTGSSTRSSSRSPRNCAADGRLETRRACAEAEPDLRPRGRRHGEVR